MRVSPDALGSLGPGKRTGLGRRVARYCPKAGYEFAPLGTLALEYLFKIPGHLAAPTMLGARPFRSKCERLNPSISVAALLVPKLSSPHLQCAARHHNLGLGLSSMRRTHDFDPRIVFSNQIRAMHNCPLV